MISNNNFVLYSEDLAEQLYYVAARGEMEDVFRLLEEGADPNHPVYDREHVGQTPLHWACFHDCPEAARKLIDCGAKVDARDNAKQQTPLHWACWEGSLSCVKVLLSHSTDDLGQSLKAAMYYIHVAVTHAGK